MINICFHYLDQHFLGQLDEIFDFHDFHQLVLQHFNNPFDYRFTLANKELDLFSRQSFARYQSLLTNGIFILVLKRMSGGGFLEISVLTDIILQDLERAVQQIPTNNNEERPCQVCRENTSCMKLCCNRICKVCFGDYFAHSTFKLNCMTCRRQVPYGQFFISPEFVRALESLNEICGLMKYIDCQICHCGSLVVNETLYAQQTCGNCTREFWFFCNKDWTEGKIPRKNDRYTCHVSCDYETKLSYELIPLQYNKNVHVPNRRFCPSCFTLGSYDEKCKYHTCSTCQHSFCFICLEEEDTCKTKYNSNYQHQCTDVKKQTYENFPRIAKC
ncbi:unnamed protein product [Adineta ricciae]|uniref:RING-type domain-containing protein n=1 Tax=Adineta ricciae TaxID=249248 RepID=A0A813Z0D3_ADIRI|nr:unnamed protein product [Adineta ricciae]CAF1424607.1 unnamed protein product [Adineta ricciae]